MEIKIISNSLCITWAKTHLGSNESHKAVVWPITLNEIYVGGASCTSGRSFTGLSGDTISCGLWDNSGVIKGASIREVDVMGFILGVI